MTREEYPLLEKFLYEAIFIPEGIEKPPRDIIQNADLRVYIDDFGKHKDDYCLAADDGGKIIGACWARIMNARPWRFRKRITRLKCTKMSDLRQLTKTNKNT